MARFKRKNPNWAMSESIWWPDEPWWERKLLPVGFITLSFRQVTTIVLTFLTAFVVSLPFEFAIAGVSFGGRAAAFCIVFGVGYTISSRRVKLLPVELQAFFFLRTKGVRKVRMKLGQLLESKSERLAEKKHTSGPRSTVLYELRSVNLTSLPEKEQASVLDRFASFLDSLTEPITFHIVQDEREVMVIGAMYKIPYKRFFVETRSQVDSLIQKLGTRMVRPHALPQIKSTVAC